MGSDVSVIGCGWLGFPLAQQLLAQGYAVKGSTTTAAKLPVLQQAGIEAYLLQLNPLPQGNLPALLQARTLVVNIPPAAKQFAAETETRHLQQMQALCEAVAASEVQQVILVSSTSVYAPLGRLVTEEDAALGTPATAAGRALRAVEQLWQQQGRFGVTILRMAGLAGGSRHPGRFLAGRVEVAGGNAPVNLVHLDDCIGVICEVLQQNCFPAVFNVCADEHPTRREFYPFAARQLHLQPPVFLPPETDTELAGNYISNTRLTTQLGYRFKYPDPFGFAYSE
ncbi:SDR family NAD(P)-dependent oxidoreductase [Sphingobacteriales bacterium UPWRP_1]|nr:hypothetical protein B6N25_00645 [Sphingobacteriales bacterium TSM_CSS]PSJ71990.1 SDR family NAD(P)-dependent oxidoreductase [Sphingobacteriales bacterium UPWRP_1]